MAIQKDNSTFKQKVALRKLMLDQMGETPVIVETHGGMGQVWAAVYASVEQGVVFEKDEDKAGMLARQRPTWAVYEADCIQSLLGGAGAQLIANVVDVAPYGEPWPAIDAFFASSRPRADRLWLVVNDGLRQGLRMGKAWSVGSLASAVQMFGNDLHDRYLDVCKWMLKEKAALAGYSLSRFAGYYCGHVQQMTHYLALLVRDSEPGPS